MRALIVVLSLMAIVFGSSACQAGMSTGPHDTTVRTTTTRHATASHRRERGRVHHARRRIGGPIAAVGNAIGSTIGGIFR
jgi:hypothetical protein